jgi:glycosyltransferase involved in cell wall biosynthesis
MSILKPVRCVCVVNNYNYGAFLAECLESVRSQSRPFDLVILVDDGSTDHSLEIAREYSGRWAQLKVISKPNGGQLSCFNAAVPFVLPDDLVTMMDSDDVYPPDYLASLLEEVSKQPADFYFCEPVEFESIRCPLATAKASVTAENFTWEVSSFSTRLWGVWFGSATSCLALTGRLYLELLPYPFEKDWVTRADDVLIWGAGLKGSSKSHLLNLQVGYRIHPRNAFARKEFPEAYHIKREIKVDRLFNYYCDRFMITRHPRDLERMARREVYCVPATLWKRYNLPKVRSMRWKVCRALRSLRKKLRSLLGAAR